MKVISRERATKNKQSRRDYAKCRKIPLSTLPLKSDDDDGFVKKIEKFFSHSTAPFL